MPNSNYVDKVLTHKGNPARKPAPAVKAKAPVDFLSTDAIMQAEPKRMPASTTPKPSQRQAESTSDSMFEFL